MIRRIINAWRYADEIAELCDRVIHLERGHKHAVEAAEIMRKEMLTTIAHNDQLEAELDQQRLALGIIIEHVGQREFDQAITNYATKRAPK